jgi:hypothetical protein
VQRGEAKRYSWGDVQLLRIRKQAHDRRDFHSLEVVLPDEKVCFHIGHQHGQSIRSWSAPRATPRLSPEVVSDALLRYVPEDRVQVTALTGPPRTMVEWQDRLALQEREGRDLILLRPILGGGGVILLIVIGFDASGNWIRSIGLLGLCGVMWGVFWAVLRYLDRDHLRAIADLEAQVPIDGSDSEPSCLSDPPQDGSRQPADAEIARIGQLERLDNPCAQGILDVLAVGKSKPAARRAILEDSCGRVGPSGRASPSICEHSVGSP